MASYADAFAISKLAWNLAQAFTKGRRSAPAEFHEVENQLYSLSATLGAFRRALDSGDVTQILDTGSAVSSNGEGDGVVSVRRVLSNCEETLHHLQEFMKKYDILGEQKTPSNDVGTSSPRLARRLTDSLARDYKKIAWTTQKSDLEILRGQLMVHTNSLGLVIGVILNSQATRIEDTLKEHSAILKEIQSWGSARLGDEKLQVVSRQATESTISCTYHQPILFEVYVEQSDGSRRLVCGQASLHDQWAANLELVKQDDETPIFECRHHLTDGSDHSSSLKNFNLSHFTFPFRLLGARRAWMLYKMAETSTNKLVSLVIHNVTLNKIAEFERTFVDILSEAKASQMLSQGMSTMLAHASPTVNQLRILNLQSYVNNVPNSLESVTIASGHRVYTRKFIDSVLLLHYKSLDQRNEELNMLAPSSSSIMLDSAEIAINYAEDEDEGPGDIARSIIEIKYNTHVKYDEGQTTVTVVEAPCHGYRDNEQLLSIDKTDVTFSFTNPQDAGQCAEQLEDMKMELWAWRLQHPQPDEIVALHLQTAQVHCEDFYIPDAEIFILRRPDNRFRLLISSRNKCTTLSQVLPEDFFKTLGKPPNFRTQAWRVQLEDGGERKIYSYDRGLEFLKFHSDEAEQMFQLGRSTLSGTLPVRTITGAG